MFAMCDVDACVFSRAFASLILFGTETETIATEETLRVCHQQQPKRKNGRTEGKWIEDGVRGNDEKRNSAEVRSHNNINTFP